MPEGLPVRRVQVSFAGSVPVRQVARASGVSDVETDGATLRCLVCGSFQPFLEALRGHEVVGFDSVPALTEVPVHTCDATTTTTIHRHRAGAG